MDNLAKRHTRIEPARQRATEGVLRILPRNGYAAGLVLLYLVASLGPLATTAAAFCRLSTGMPEPGLVGECSVSGVPLFWKNRCISYSVVERERDSPVFDDKDPDIADIRDVIDISFAAWTDVECAGDPLPLSLRQTVPLSRCDIPKYNPDAPNSNSIAFVEDWFERGLPVEAYGVTLVWHNPDTGEIVDADMQLNENAGTIAFCDSSCNGDGVDLGNVVTHEAGHFLGLGHSDEVNASMYGESTRGETRKGILNDDDAQGICAIYGELPAVECREADYRPRNGWSPRCNPGGDSCAVSHVGHRPERAPLALLLLALCWCAMRRMRRMRVAGSLSLIRSPSATKLRRRA